MNSPKKIFDSLLVLQYQSGNKKALTLLVKRWHAKFCKQAYWYTRDMEVSNDIAQDSWSKICAKIHQLKDSNNFGSWALTIVTHQAMDWLRNQKRELENLESYRNQHQEISGKKLGTDTEKAILELKKSIRKLPKKQQVVLHLFYIEEYTVKQIGTILQISDGTVKSRLFTAREKLKSIVKKGNYEK